MRSTFITISIFLSLLTDLTARRIPDYIPICKRNDPDLDSCVIKAIDMVRPYLEKGIPELHVPPYDPLEIPGLTVDRENDALDVKATFKNMKVFGAKNFKITKFTSDLKRKAVNASVEIPFIHFTTEYDIDGRVLVVPIKGKGSAQGNITEGKGELKLVGHVLTRKGKAYLEADDLITKLQLGDADVHFNNLFGNNAVLGQTTNAFLKQNRKQIIEVILPIIEETMSAIFLQIINRILTRLPYDEVLPPT